MASTGSTSVRFRQSSSSAPDGKELKRFTMDDPNHQFTYEQVEKEVAALLEGAVSKEPAK